MSVFVGDPNETILAVSYDFVNFQTDHFSVRAANPSPELESSLLTWRVFVTISSLIAVLIMTGNALVIAAYATNSRLRTGTYNFLVSLAMSDFLVGSVSIPIWIYLSAPAAMNDSPKERKGPLPAVFKYVDIFSAMASIFHLVVICVERHIAISRPFKHISASFYRIMITAAWLLAIMFSLIWEIEFVSKFYALVVFVGGFLLPMLVIAFVYGKILRTARALIRRTPEFRGVSTTSQRRSNRIRDERRVTITVSLVSVLFVLCWLPFFLLSVIANFSPSGILPSDKLHLQMLVVVVKWMHYSNSVVNPVVYAFRDREMRATFRTEFVKLLPQMCTKHLESQAQRDRLGIQRPNPSLVIPPKIGLTVL